LHLRTDGGKVLGPQKKCSFHLGKNPSKLYLYRESDGSRHPAHELRLVRIYQVSFLISPVRG
jgi:hypothetical protein